MFIKSIQLFACVAVVSLIFAGQVRAAQPTYTTIHVSDMHCDACAKKIAAELYVLPGVHEVRADVPKSIAYVVPKSQENVSPRAVWEAVEKAGFTPVKLSGPSGVFTGKPKS